MANFSDFLVNILSGVAGGQQAQASPLPQTAPRPTPRPVNLPRTAPRPTPRPSLPGGSFAPNRQTLPANAPVPTPRPDAPIKPGTIRKGPDGQNYQYAETKGMAGATGDYGWIPTSMSPQQQQPQNPLMELLAGGGSGGDWRKMLRSAASGVTNVDPSATGILSAAQGMQGAQGYYSAQDAAAAEKAREREQTMYERSQDAANLDLERAAEERKAKRAEVENRKTAAELTRLAKQNGLTVSQMLEIEKLAQKAGEDLITSDPEVRRKAVDAERERLMKMYAGTDDRDGLSGTDGGGLSGDSAPKEYPDARKAPDGNWYVERDGQYYRVEQ